MHVGNTLASNPQVFCQQFDKKTPFGKMNSQICFFIGVTMKIAVLVRWQCRCDNLMICSLMLEIQKRCFYLKKCCFGVCAVDFEAIPPPSCYLKLV